MFHSFWLVHNHFSRLKALFLRPRRSAPGQGQSATKADAFHHAGDEKTGGFFGDLLMVFLQKMDGDFCWMMVKFWSRPIIWIHIFLAHL